MEVIKKEINVYKAKHGALYDTYQECIEAEVEREMERDFQVVYVVEESRPGDNRGILKAVFSTREKAEKYKENCLFNLSKISELTITLLWIDLAEFELELKKRVNERIREYEAKQSETINPLEVFHCSINSMIVKCKNIYME